MSLYSEKVKIINLSELCHQIFAAVGIDDAVVRVYTDLLVKTDFQGVIIHGTIRVPIYPKSIRNGQLSSGSTIKRVNDDNAPSLIEVNYCKGQYVGTRAMAVEIEKASEHRIGAVALCNSNHLGEMEFYSLMAAEKNIIGFCTPDVVDFIEPTGGAVRLLGNNLFSFTIPAETYNLIILDMSCPNFFRVNVLLNVKHGQPVPQVWILNNKSEHTTGSNALSGAGGSLIPLGEQKAYGLSLVMELLTVVLSQRLFSHKIQTLYDLNVTESYKGAHFFMAIDVDRFLPVETFINAAAQLITRIKTSREATDKEKIYSPGGIKHKTKEKNISDGFQVKSLIINELNTYAKELGITNEI